MRGLAVRNSLVFTAVAYALAQLPATVEAAPLWIRNESDPRWTHCHVDPTISTAHILSHFQSTGPTFAEFEWLTEFQRLATQDHVGGSQDDEFKRLYEQFCRPLDCYPWDKIVQYQMARVSIQNYLRSLFCMRIREFLVSMVRGVYPCEVAVAPLGRLNEVFLARGRRISTLYRYVLGLSADAATLGQYDEYFERCFIDFFDQIGAVSGQQGSAYRRAKTVTNSWPWVPFGLALLVVALTIIRFRHLAETHAERQPPTNGSTPTPTRVNEPSAPAELSHPD